MILSIEGEEKTGKTTLSYSGPLKVVGFQFDLGHDRAINGTKYNELFKGLNIKVVDYKEGKEPEQVWSNYDITIYKLPRPIQIDQTRVHGAKELWHYFLKLYGPVLMDSKVGSIVIDTMTVARKIKADAYLQELQELAEKRSSHMREQLTQIEYGKNVNDPIREIYVGTGAQEKNLIAVHHLDDERVDQAVVQSDGSIKKDSVLTGNKVLEGLRDTYKHIDVAVRQIKAKDKVQSRIEICGYDLSLVGRMIPDLTWDRLANVISDTLGGRITFDRRNHQ